MSRTRGKRKLSLCTTISIEAYDRVGEIADNTNEGNVSKTVEMLITDYWNGFMTAVEKRQEDEQN